jgi:hypothetical protein
MIDLQARSTLKVGQYQVSLTGIRHRECMMG